MIRTFTTLKKIKKPINITKNAWIKMSDILDKKNSLGFVFSASSGGCNGFNYDFKLYNSKEHDEIFFDKTLKIQPTIIENNEKNKIKVFIDPMSEMFLLGTTIDYVFEDIDKGIYENKFIFTADKEIASSCGCGVSFSPKMF